MDINWYNMSQEYELRARNLVWIGCSDQTVCVLQEDHGNAAVQSAVRQTRSAEESRLLPAV